MRRTEGAGSHRIKDKHSMTSASFDFVNLVSALIYVVTLPLVAVVTTYLYFDLVVRERLAPEQAPRGQVLPAEI